MGLRLRKHAEGIELVGDPPEIHHFSPSFVDGALAEGWASMGRGELTLHLDSGDVVYEIIHRPGAAVCEICEEQIGIGAAAAAEAGDRLAHVASHDEEIEGAGYDVQNYWDLKLKD